MFKTVLKQFFLHLRPEDVLAMILIVPSIYIISPSEYITFFDGSIVASKHVSALFLLIIFSVATSLYENRKQRIIDTIKSGVKIPQVKIKDQLYYLWKHKIKIVGIFRDYLPFVLCLIAYSKLSGVYLNFYHINIDDFYMMADKMMIENYRIFLLNVISKIPQYKDFLRISYNTYLISVPVLAIYLYLLKHYNKFREFMLAIVITSIFSLLGSYFLPSYGLQDTIAGIKSNTNGSISLPAVYTTLVLFFSLSVNVTLTLFYMPIALFFFLADILTYSHYIIAILSGSLLGLISIPLAKLIMKLWTTKIFYRE